MHQRVVNKKLKAVGGKSEGLIRWTLRQAEREFLIHRNTIRKHLDLVDIRPGKDGCFSSAEMLYGLSDFVRWHWSEVPDYRSRHRAEADIAANNRRVLGR